MMDNYPPGAANDPRAPYNERLREEREVIVTESLECTVCIDVGDDEYHYLSNDDLKAYFSEQCRSAIEIIRCCEKIVKQLREDLKKEHKSRFYAGIDLGTLEMDCEYWEQVDFKIEG